LKKICAKYDVYIFISSDHDLCPSDLKFALLVIIVQRNVSSKLEVSKPFLLKGNWRHWTDGQGATINAAPYGEPHNN